MGQSGWRSALSAAISQDLYREEQDLYQGTPSGVPIRANMNRALAPEEDALFTPFAHL